MLVITLEDIIVIVVITIVIIALIYLKIKEWWDSKIKKKSEKVEDKE